jgi:hypothetical protein
LIPHTAIARNLALLVLLVVIGSPATAAEETIRVDVERVLAKPVRSQNPDVAKYGLQFDLRLTNGSQKSVNVPALDTADGETTRIFLLDVQSKLPDGPWTNVIQSSWYGLGTEKYDLCKPLVPAATTEIGGLTSQLLLLKKQLASLGGASTVRFYVMMFCRQSDGKVVTTTLPTEGFSLRLPTPPGN